MKTSILFIVGITTLIFTSCGKNNGTYDASGIFEAREVTVSARSTGELIQFDIEEGQKLEAGKQAGYIDTVQLHLKKMQLLAGMKSVESRQYNVSRQIASIQQQIATQKTEQKRFENLVQSNAANRKQLDDNNRSVSGESLGLIAQIDQIDDQIQKSIISSPIDGTVLSKYAEQGELAIQGRTLFKVADIENMTLRVYITADQLTSLKIGQSVKVYADRGKSDRKEYSGTITWISDKAEFTPKTIQTRDERANLVYAVKVAVKNDGYIKKGMYGEIKIN